MSYRRLIREMETSQESDSWWEMPSGLLILTILILSLAFLISPVFAHAAIARDVHGGVTGSADTGKTLSLTLAAGDTALFAAVYDDAPVGVSSVKWNGTPLTLIEDCTNAFVSKFQIYYLANPASGTHNLVNVMNSSSYNELAGSAYSGTGTTVPTASDCQSNASTAGSISNTLSNASGGWFFGFAGGQLLTGTTNAVQLDQLNGGFQVTYDSNGIAGSNTMTVSNGATSRISLAGVSFNTLVTSPFIPDLNNWWGVL